ncbi:uncharacterized protein LOC134718729 [Mytilus trossulus]|uniref:uncharacterized protein LOC134718729 n=1 Tax=Mytilus trossulus TaxID=6551 RepID=UPI003004A0A8
MFINGFSRVSFEGFLQKIDTNIQLYELCSTKTYNQRSISSLANETFFGELSQMEDTRLGCPKAISITRLMSTITEILHYRSDPSDRSFSITSTRKCVYPVPSLLNDTRSTAENNDTLEESKPSLIDIQQEDGKIKIIQLKDHFFDSVLRKRKKQRQSKRSDISKLHEVTRGCLPVRQYHKCDESKILPTTRLGINLSGPTDAEN